MTIRTTTLLTGEEAEQMKRHLPLGMRVLVRIRGGEVGANAQRKERERKRRKGREEK